VCTAAMLDSAVGPNVIKRLNAGLDAFMERHGYASIEDFRGLRRDRVVLQSQIRRPEGEGYGAEAVEGYAAPERGVTA
jgi:dihydropyrimidine dehydrogenase (NAD+) subunit PreA